MFVRPKIFNFLHKAFKTNTRLYVTVTQHKAIVHIPNYLQSKAFFSNGTKPVEPIKSPLSNLITKDVTPPKKEEDDEEAKRSREASWRTMKYTLFIFGGSMTGFALYLLFELGKPPVDENGLTIKDEFSHMSAVKQYIYRTLDKLDYYKRLIREPSREKLLPDPVKYPYYQPPYTLVLELTDVLVHPDWTYKTGWRFKKRPGIDGFLESLSGLFEIVIFTAEQGMTVFPIIDALDPKNLIAYKLVRDATHFVEGHHVKNLDKLNRDLSKVIVIDWNPDSVKFHPENVFHISRWSGNNDDSTLLDLAAFLQTVAHSEIQDVREVLKYYSDFDDPLGTFRSKQKELVELQEAERVAKSHNIESPVKRWSRNFLGKSM
ncbi:hypothetical protein RN001_015960 [Aquatica leii]|uniref:Mitochondrial import inner membrane translocase subunit TIM50 n=1 Tax=Aquatica leii TaxID=1421715 RepID=A0AAN7P142_9COLE|nr:hypothetical protein RN001_015960 [Aquatica leii]